jgi:hypothetical protein
MTTEIMLVITMVVVFALVVTLAYVGLRMRFYFSEWLKAETRISDWISRWKNEKERADNLQVELRLAQVAKGGEER